MSTHETRDRLIYRRQAIEARRLTIGTEDSMFPLRPVVRYQQTMAVTGALADNQVRTGTRSWCWCCNKQGYKKTIERQNALYSKRQWLMLVPLRTNRVPYPSGTEPLCLECWIRFSVDVFAGIETDT